MSENFPEACELRMGNWRLLIIPLETNYFYRVVAHLFLLQVLQNPKLRLEQQNQLALHQLAGQ